MKHADEPGKDKEPFDRFEAEMTEAGDVVDLNKARAERTGIASVEVDSADAADEESEEGKPVPGRPSEPCQVGCHGREAPAHPSRRAAGPHGVPVRRPPGRRLRGLRKPVPRSPAAVLRRSAHGGDMDGMRFVFDICRDGPGYRADLDLPYGVVPEDVMEERKALASGLRHKMGSVWPSGDPTEHEGRLVLWVGDKPMNETKKPAWPLAKSGTVDLFKPVVFGNDQRMRPLTVTLMFASVVIGSIPRMGKTFLLRLFLLICALDPRATQVAGSTTLPPPHRAHARNPFRSDAEGHHGPSRAVLGAGRADLSALRR